jgi:hypothetical protein
MGRGDTVKRDVQGVAMDFIYSNIICRLDCLLEITVDMDFHFVNGLGISNLEGNGK